MIKSLSEVKLRHRAAGLKRFEGVARKRKARYLSTVCPVLDGALFIESHSDKGEKQFDVLFISEELGSIHIVTKGYSEAKFAKAEMRRRAAAWRGWPIEREIK